MDETATLPQEPITQPAPAPEATPASAPADPFQLEESSFATLTPEQRAGLDPIWKRGESVRPTKFPNVNRRFGKVQTG